MSITRCGSKNENKQTIRVYARGLGMKGTWVLPFPVIREVQVHNNVG